MKTWRLTSSIKFIHPLQVMYENLTEKSSLKLLLSWRPWPQLSKKKAYLHFWCSFLYNWIFSGSITAIFKLILTENKLFHPAQVALTKMLSNEAQIYQQRGFISTEGYIHINFLWLLQDLSFLIGRCTGYINFVFVAQYILPNC